MGSTAHTPVTLSSTANPTGDPHHYPQDPGSTQTVSPLISPRNWQLWVNYECYFPFLFWLGTLPYLLLSFPPFWKECCTAPCGLTSVSESRPSCLSIDSRFFIVASSSLSSLAVLHQSRKTLWHSPPLPPSHLLVTAKLFRKFCYFCRSDACSYKHFKQHRRAKKKITVIQHPTTHRYHC